MPSKKATRIDRFIRGFIRLSSRFRRGDRHWAADAAGMGAELIAFARIGYLAAANRTARVITNKDTANLGPEDSKRVLKRFWGIPLAHARGSATLALRGSVTLALRGS